MRSQDWKARNAPSGPPLVIRCRGCQKPLLTLENGETLTKKSEVSHKRDIDCVHEGCNARNIFWVQEGNKNAAV